MNMAVDQVHSLKDANKTFTILSVPRTTVLCENVLEQEQLSSGTENSQTFNENFVNFYEFSRCLLRLTM
jgi:hypothetical protein